MASEVRALSLLSGGLDSRLAVLVLQKQGVHVEGVVFDSPFFDLAPAKDAARQLGVQLHIYDFTSDIIELLKHPAHGFGGAMNPCIDCHARMIRRAGEMMRERGFDLVATGEVAGQRPMSQNRQALNTVRRDSGLEGYLLRPLSAKLLEPTIPEMDGRIDREQLLDLSGRNRKPQLALAQAFGLDHWPNPAGGCLLTEKRYGERLKELAAHEGLDNLAAIKLLRRGRHFRLPEGTRAIVGRDSRDNASLKAAAGADDLVVATVSVPGPTILLPACQSEADRALAVRLCAAYGDHVGVTTVTVRTTQNGVAREETVAPEEKSAFAHLML